MTAQGETTFKKGVQADLKRTFGKHCKELKTNERARRGVPDLILCLFGDYVAIELKIDGEEPTPLQQVFLDDVSAAGGTAFCATPSVWDAQLLMLKERYANRLKEYV